MLRCINCHLCVDRMLRHVVSSIQSTLQTLLAKWKSLQHLPPEAVICFLRLDQHCRNGNVNAEIDLGHAHVYLGCGRSVLETRRRVRYHTVEASDPLIATILSWDIHNEVISIYAFVYHLCWMRANRQLSQDVLRGQPGTDEHAELENQPVDPEQLPVPHQEIPVPPSLPPPQEQQVPMELAESRAYIILPHYKRAANISSHCIFPGCANQSGHLIPLLIKVLPCYDHYMVPWLGMSSRQY